MANKWIRRVVAASSVREARAALRRDRCGRRGSSSPQLRRPTGQCPGRARCGWSTTAAVIFGRRPARVHSVFLWKANGNVYLVASDDEELHDVDIFDVSTPRKPEADRRVRHGGAVPADPREPCAERQPRPQPRHGGEGDQRRHVLLDSYWDAGYLLIDVENPAKPAYIGDNDFTVLRQRSGAPGRRGRRGDVGSGAAGPDTERQGRLRRLRLSRRSDGAAERV
jgi:hypothetical protein